VTSQFPSAFGSLFTLTELSPLVCWVNIKWNTQMLGQEGTLRLALAVVTLWRVLSISLFYCPPQSSTFTPAVKRQNHRGAGNGLLQTKGLFYHL
jgi:hypothetical protein